MKKNDIMVFAPHPDDEAFGCAGLIYTGVHKGKKVKVVVVTNGEGSEDGTERFYGRKPSTQDFIDIGYVRQKETIAAMKLLGLESEDVIFLGYPDNGLSAMISSDEYTVDKPYKSESTQFDRVNHENSRSMGAPFCKENLYVDIESVLKEFRPGRVYVSHPRDSHGDHKACGEIVHGIAGEFIEPGNVFGYMIARSGVPSPKRRSISKSTGQLTEVHLDEQVRKIKEKCVKLYKSQSYLFDELGFHFEVERFWKLDEGTRAAIAKKLIPGLRD